jgi:hypothetical protein
MIRNNKAFAFSCLMLTVLFVPGQKAINTPSIAMRKK